jgi:hypothetical protein
MRQVLDNCSDSGIACQMVYNAHGNLISSRQSPNYLTPTRSVKKIAGWEGGKSRQRRAPASSPHAIQLRGIHWAVLILMLSSISLEAGARRWRAFPLPNRQFFHSSAVGGFSLLVPIFIYKVP